VNRPRRRTDRTTSPPASSRLALYDDWPAASHGYRTIAGAQDGYAHRHGVEELIALRT